MTEQIKLVLYPIIVGAFAVFIWWMLRFLFAKLVDKLDELISTITGIKVDLSSMRERLNKVEEYSKTIVSLQKEIQSFEVVDAQNKVLVGELKDKVFLLSEKVDNTGNDLNEVKNKIYELKVQFDSHRDVKQS